MIKKNCKSIVGFFLEICYWIIFKDVIVLWYFNICKSLNGDLPDLFCQIAIYTFNQYILSCGHVHVYIQITIPRKSYNKLDKYCWCIYILFVLNIVSICHQICQLTFCPGGHSLCVRNKNHEIYIIARKNLITPLN